MSVPIIILALLAIANGSENPYCQKADYCIPVEVVSFTKKDGRPYLSQERLDYLENGVNQIWSPCKIAFRFSPLEAIIQSQFGVQEPLRSRSQLDWDSNRNPTKLFSTYFKPQHIAVIATSGWNNDLLYLPTNGIKTRTAAFADYSFDPKNYSAVIFIGPHSHFEYVTFAHELGHALTLDHAKGSGRLMSPEFDYDNKYISNFECLIAHDYVKKWPEFMSQTP